MLFEFQSLKLERKKVTHGDPMLMVSRIDIFILLEVLVMKSMKKSNNDRQTHYR